MSADLERHITQYTQTAVDLARRGADLAFDLMGSVTTALKSDRSIITEADLRVQDMIVRQLRTAFPDHGILAEEKSGLLDDDERQRPFVWVIDPIDGTRNYAAGIGLFTCSVALLSQGRPVAAAIALPTPPIVCHANLYEPTQRNDTVVATSKRPFGNDCVIALSVSQQDHVPNYLRRWIGRRVLRDFGSAAGHLAMVACGMVDAAVGIKVKLWDIAAGALLVSQAGGRVVALDPSAEPTDHTPWPIDLRRYHNETVPILAGSNAVVEGLLAEMRG